MRGFDSWENTTLVLLRHGESEWNALNLFTGWVDVDLTEKGRAEAIRGGELMAEQGLLPDVLYTSVLRRAINTANLALDKADRHWIPVHRNWRLNERHYGALQGLDKAETKAKYGEEQFMAWRRSYDTPPPPIEKGSKYSQDADPRYADIDGGPLTECLADVVARFVPYYTETIVPDLQAGKTVLIAAHGNSLRALVKYLDGMSDEDVVGLNIPTGIPLRYDLDENLKPTVPAARTWIRRPRPPAPPRWPVRAPSKRFRRSFGEQSVNAGERRPNTCVWACDMSRFGCTLLGCRSSSAYDFRVSVVSALIVAGIFLARGDGDRGRGVAPHPAAPATGRRPAGRHHDFADAAAHRRRSPARRRRRRHPSRRGVHE